MFKTPTEYAEMLLALYFGRKDDALAEVFGAAKAHPTVPNAFFRDVFLAIQESKGE